MPFKDKEKLKEYRRQYYLNNKNKWKCEHNKRKSTCAECKGSQICEHNKRRSTCVECKGSQICEHDKIRSRCVDCGEVKYANITKEDQNV